jgi:hypothetical protein
MPEQRDRSFRLNLEVHTDNPNLLTGLDRWLELGLIDDLQVRELCRNHLTCRVPATVVQSLPELPPVIVAEPEIPFIPARRQPSVLSTIWASFKDELSVRWLLFLGVFLVILSSGVLAATQWQRFPAWGQYGVLWAYTIAFWGVGAWASGQSGLSLTANTLQIVALLLIPVNFWAIDSFQLWHNPLEWLTALFAVVSLSGLAYLEARKRSPEVGLSRMAIAYLGLSFLQLGWQLPSWATIAVYLGAIGGVGLWQRRRQIFGDKTWQWASLAIYSLTILLLRALFIERLPIYNFGLAIAIIGWLVAQWGLQQWAKIDRIDAICDRSSKARDFTAQRITATELAGKYQTVAGILLAIGWLLAMSQWGRTLPHGSSWQPLAVDGLVLIWLWQRLKLRHKSADLVWMFIVGLQTYGASFAIAPDFIPFAKWDFGGQLLSIFGENAAWAGTLVAMPYLFLWIAISGWLQRTQQAKLANTAETLVFSFGLLLNLLSIPNHLGLLLNLVLSTLALLYITHRQESVRTSLIYATHLYGLITIAVGVDYFFPSLQANAATGIKWGTLAAIFAIGEWFVSTLPVMSGSTRDRWYRSAWHYGLGLSAISYCAYLSIGKSPVGWIVWTLESFAPFSYWSLIWLFIPLALTWLAYQRLSSLTTADHQEVPWQIERQTAAAQYSVGSLILAQGLTFGHADWRFWGLGFATGLMFFNARRLRDLTVTAIHLGFGLSAVTSLLSTWIFDSTWLVVGSIFCLMLWLAAARLRRQESDLAQLYAQASDKWAIGLSAVGIAIGTLNYVGNYLPWAWSNEPQTQLHYPNLAIASVILTIAIWYRQRSLAKPIAVWTINWTLQLGIAEVIHLLGGSTLILAIVNIAIAFTLLFLPTTPNPESSPASNSPPRRGARMGGVGQISMLPWFYALLAIILRITYFTPYTGAISIAAGILSILVGIRLTFSLPAYIGLTAITLGCYELLTFQILKTPPAGGNIADAFTIYGLITAVLALGYRLSIWWWEKRGNTKWLSLSIDRATAVAHIHWLAASGWKIAAALVPQLPLPKFTSLHLGISILLGLYAVIQGRKRDNGGDWWVYVGLVEILGTGMYARSIFTSLGSFDEFIIVIACIVALAMLVAPWTSWGWQDRPWQRVAVVLPILRVLFVPAHISLLNLLVIAGFYFGVAKRQNQFGWIYISLIFANWAAFRGLDYYQLRDPLWFAAIVGISLLLSVQFDPFFRSTNQRENRHIARLIGSGSIAITALITHQNLPLIPAGISLLLTFLGIALSIRAFLYMGTITLMLTVSYQLIILATEYPFTKWIVGLAAGVLIIAIAGNFERRREQIYTTVRNWLDRLQEWQ